MHNASLTRQQHMKDSSMPACRGAAAASLFVLSFLPPLATPTLAPAKPTWRPSIGHVQQGARELGTIQDTDHVLQS